MNKYYLIIFIAVFSSIYFGLHYYVYHRIASGFSLNARQSLYFRIFIFLGAVSFFAAEMLSRRTTGVWGGPVSWLGFTWLGIIAISFTVLLLRDLSLILIHYPGFKYHSVVAALILIFITCAYSIWNAAQAPVIKTIEVRISKLPARLSGFTIVQLSDIHVDLQTPLWWLQSIVKRANELNPDLIVITGDIIDADLFGKIEYCDTLKGLKAKYGVIATTGNHEFYAGVEKFTRLTAYCGMTELRGKSTTVADDIIILTGIDDTEVERFEHTKRSLKKALYYPDLDKSKPTILLSHRPDIFDEAASEGIDLTLSGHTHWGQIPPVDIFVKLFQKYSVGYHKKGGSVIYTTSGTGTWGPAMRLFSRNEIVKIILRNDRTDK